MAIVQEYTESGWPIHLQRGWYECTHTDLEWLVTESALVIGISKTHVIVRESKGEYNYDTKRWEVTDIEDHPCPIKVIQGVEHFTYKGWTFNPKMCQNPVENWFKYDKEMKERLNEMREKEERRKAEKERTDKLYANILEHECVDDTI